MIEQNDYLIGEAVFEEYVKRAYNKNFDNLVLLLVFCKKRVVSSGSYQFRVRLTSGNRMYGLTEVSKELVAGFALRGI